MTELLHMTLCELSEALRNKQASPVELMGAVFDRIDAVNEQLHAVIAMFDRDELMARARDAEARVMAGEARVFEGIPLGVKDLEDAVGLPTTHGSVPFKDHMPKRDSTQVQRLKRAGAIVIGKTNTPEFGSTAITKNLLFGASTNPWDTSMSPGGSSGGSSAAVAAQMLPLVTASDGGGSVRIPACLVGAFGLKPSYGRIPMGPFERWPWLGQSCFGPITKTVQDAALFLDQTAGVSPHDQNSLPDVDYSYLARVREPIEGKLRIGYYPDLGYMTVQQEVADAVEEGLQVFEKLGHHVERVEGGPPTMTAGWVFLNDIDAYCHLSPMFAEHEQDFGRGYVKGIKRAEHIDTAGLEKMIRRRMQLIEWTAEVFDRFDVFISPTVAYDGHPARGPFPDSIDAKPAHYSGPGGFTLPFNLSWHPAATVRVGRSSRGLPMGMQIAAAHHRDDLVLQVARAFERERPWHDDWPTL